MPVLEDRPNRFNCPITWDVMSDPYMTRSGINYEKNAILAWLRTNNFDPSTREALTARDLFPNRALKEEIVEWKRRHGHPIEPEPTTGPDYMRNIVLNSQPHQVPQRAHLQQALEQHNGRMRSRTTVAPAHMHPPPGNNLPRTRFPHPDPIFSSVPNVPIARPYVRPPPISHPNGIVLGIEPTEGSIAQGWRLATNAEVVACKQSAVTLIGQAAGTGAKVRTADLSVRAPLHGRSRGGSRYIQWAWLGNGVALQFGMTPGTSWEPSATLTSERGVTDGAANAMAELMRRQGLAQIQLRWRFVVKELPLIRFGGQDLCDPLQTIADAGFGQEAVFELVSVNPNVSPRRDGDNTSEDHPSLQLYVLRPNGGKIAVEVPSITTVGELAALTAAQLNIDPASLATGAHEIPAPTTVRTADVAYP